MATFADKSDFVQYEKRIQRHKKQKLFILIGILLIAAAICVYLVYSYINRVFNNYTVSVQIERQEAGVAQYLPYGDKLLKVTKDGASAYDSIGNITFNGSYNMRSPKADICEDYVAVADIGGKSIYVFDGSNSGKQITVNLPILQVQVARQGMVAVLMEDKDTNVIQLIKSDTTVDSLVAKVVTNVEDNGFPVNIALSDDGKRLLTNYMQVNNGVIKNQVTFYSFSDVGENEINRMVGMKDYGDTTVADVLFIGNNTACVLTTTGFELFSFSEKPHEIYQQTFEQAIKSVFHTSEYIGFVIENYDEADKYKVLVYNTKGDKVYDDSISFDYDKVIMSEKEMIFYSEKESHIIKTNGVEKFKFAFDGNVSGIMPINNYNKYYLINDTDIDIIKLTED